MAWALLQVLVGVGDKGRVGGTRGCSPILSQQLEVVPGKIIPGSPEGKGQPCLETELMLNSTGGQLLQQN